MCTEGYLCARLCEDVREKEEKNQRAGSAPSEEQTHPLVTRVRSAESLG